jgi:hypothetical protein
MTKTLHAFVGTAVLCLAQASQAQAPVSPQILAAAAATQRVDISASTAQSMASEALRELRGSYTLSNGSQLHVSARGRRLLASLDDRIAVPLLATGANQFVSADGAMRVQFHAHDNGHVTGLTMSVQRAAK